jgi:uncharacterized protein (DUF2225 family)
MTTLTDEIRACPVCESRFPVTAVNSCGSHGADSDFRPHYWGPDPLENYVHSCSECGFSGYQQDFLDGVSETVIRKIRKFLSPRTRDLQRPNAPFFRYEFMALIYEWEDRSSLEVGDSFLKASWVARARGNRARDQSRRTPGALWLPSCRHSLFGCPGAIYARRSDPGRS